LSTDVGGAAVWPVGGSALSRTRIRAGGLCPAARTGTAAGGRPVHRHAAAARSRAAISAAGRPGAAAPAAGPAAAPAPTAAAPATTAAAALDVAGKQN
jgi:hypothetical protein